jgi:transcriptional regulator with XRE-family HTH domain
MTYVINLNYKWQYIYNYICNINYYCMKERLLEFLRAENKSSAQFAEEIGVQPSGISHILSGRNNPSLDFVLKMLEKYQFISTDWLLFGKGSMYKDIKMQTLFNDENHLNQNITEKLNQKEDVSAGPGIFESLKDQKQSSVSGQSGRNNSSIERIIWFYDDNSFEDFHPHK